MERVMGPGLRTREKLLAVLLEEKDERIDQLEETLARTESELSLLRERVQHLEVMLAHVSGSASYRLAHRLARTVRFIAPPGTGRRRALHLGLRGLRAVPKLRNRQWVAAKSELMLNGSRAKIGLLLDSYRKMGDRLLGPRWALRRALSNPPSFQILDPVDVSIIIPVFNHWQDTFTCLDSIARLTSGPCYEVIVVDDCSSDATPDMLRRIKGLVTLRNQQNLGFIGSCNRGAAAARGDFLVFLNNDTVVTGGWLDALARTFQTIPGTGLAGAKLIYPDGRLQEAGSVIWRDATGCNYGKFDDADHPRYNFAREVDYCSGACVMVARSLFWQLGGFDTEFTPAYYEDTDLAFKIRHAGHKVIYQPHARIIHHEGLTSGTSLDSGVKSYQRVNQTKFRKRWSERLESHSPPPPPESNLHIYIRNQEVASRTRVLLIDHRLPFPDRDCGSLRMMELIRAIRRRGHHVTFIPDDLVAWPGYLEELQFIGVEVIHRPYYPSVAEFLKQHGQDFDLAIVSRRDIAAKHMNTVRRFAPQSKIVFDTVDLHFLRGERQARLEQEQSQDLELDKKKRQEIRLAMQADLTLVVSPFEKAILEAECPGIDVRILSTIHPLQEIEVRVYDGRSTIVFIGSFEHLPNTDAVLYFAREIFPRVLARLPDVTFQVIGPDVTPEIRNLSSTSIEVLGYVPDVAPLFHQARLSVAPIRFGAGVKGKVNQSMALGVPTVVTSIAAEGMYLVHEENAMIADDPEAFADAIVRLWTSRELWERVSTGGLKNIRDHFSVEAAARPIDDLLDWAGLHRTSHSY